MPPGHAPVRRTAMHKAHPRKKVPALACGGCGRPAVFLSALQASATSDPSPPTESVSATTAITFPFVPPCGSILNLNIQQSSIGKTYSARQTRTAEGYFVGGHLPAVGPVGLHDRDQCFCRWRLSYSEVVQEHGRRSIFLYHKYNDKSEKQCYNTSVKNDKRSKKLPERKN